MWQCENGFFRDDGYPFFNAVTTRAGGNMRDAGMRRRFCEAQGIDAGALVTAEQVHGARVAVVGPADRGKKFPATDGLVTAERGIPIAILTADCVPVFFADTKRRAAGVVHAGWRGVAGGILAETVTVFKRQFNIAPHELYAAVGPHIQKCCYAVGPDMTKVFGDAVQNGHLDLNRAVRVKLEAQGVTRMSFSDSCTCHQDTEFYSYRRDKTDHRIMSVTVI
jgi:YfiH family protein